MMQPGTVFIIATWAFFLGMAVQSQGWLAP